jgi:hypothetical protein
MRPVNVLSLLDHLLIIIFYEEVMFLLVSFFVCKDDEDINFNNLNLMHIAAKSEFLVKSYRVILMIENLLLRLLFSIWLVLERIPFS